MEFHQAVQIVVQQLEVVQPVNDQPDRMAGDRIHVEHPLHQRLRIGVGVDPQDPAFPVADHRLAQISDLKQTFPLRIERKEQQFEKAGRAEHVPAGFGNRFGFELAVGVRHQAGDDFPVLVGAHFRHRQPLVDGIFVDTFRRALLESLHIQPLEIDAPVAEEAAAVLGVGQVVDELGQTRRTTFGGSLGYEGRRRRGQQDNGDQDAADHGSPP